MIKLTGSGKDGKQRFVVLGLSEGNLTRLREGKPIHVYGAELGVSHDIIIFWGPTEEHMAAEISKTLGVGPEKVGRQ